MENVLERFTGPVHYSSKEVFAFDTPVPIFTCKAADSDAVPLQKRRYVLSPFEPFGVSVAEICSQAAGEWFVGRTSRCKGFALQAWNAWGSRCSQQHVLAIPVVEPIDSLILKGKWFSICLRIKAGVCYQASFP